MLEGFKTIQEIAKEWELTPRQVQNLCASGKIPGVGKFGNAWVIPKDAKSLKTEEKQADTIKIGERNKSDLLCPASIVELDVRYV